MRYRVETHEDPRAVLEITGEFLRARPVECNVPLTILHDRSEELRPGRYWVAYENDDVAGIAVQTPPGSLLILTPSPAPVLDALADAVSTDAPDLPGVLGEALTAARFAGAWTERRRVVAQPREGGRGYRLVELTPPEGVRGVLRLANERDADLIRAWARAFDTESGNDYSQAELAVDQRLTRGRMFVWDDAGPMSMASATAPVAGASRIGFVYTPPDKRRRGYAAACVAALSRRVLDAGADTCILYTQLHNPTSNGIYRAIGYVPISELLLYEFGERAT